MKKDCVLYPPENPLDKTVADRSEWYPLDIDSSASEEHIREICRHTGCRPKDERSIVIKVNGRSFMICSFVSMGVRCIDGKASIEDFDAVYSMISPIWNYPSSDIYLSKEIVFENSIPTVLAMTFYAASTVFR